MEKDNNDIGFSLYSHVKAGGSKNVSVGNNLLGFVYIDDDKWLLVVAISVTAVPNKENPGRVDGVPLQQFENLVGRLIVKCKNPDRYGKNAM